MKSELTPWRPEDYLKTDEAQREFILAALEDGDPVAVTQALAVVMRARGRVGEGAVLDSIAAILHTTARAAKPKTGRRPRPSRVSSKT